MRHVRRYLPIAALLLAWSAALISTPHPQQPSDTSRHVVIISLDGFAGWALDDPHLPVPTLRRLASRGAAAKRMRPVNPTVTWPNHTSMVTGVTPSRHGVLFNGILLRQPGDIAPTAARLLSVELKNVEGRVLTEVLESAAEQRR